MWFCSRSGQRDQGPENRKETICAPLPGLRAGVPCVRATARDGARH